MRIRTLLLIAGLAALLVGVGSADARCAPPAPRKVVHRTTCCCAVRRRPVAVHHCVRHARAWTQAWTEPRHDAYVERHGWRDERGWSDQQSWSEQEGERMFMAWQDRRPWATDRFGYLTWPGKTHFIGGQPVEGGALPPPPPGAMPPPPPPPGADEQGPPPPPQGADSDQSYEIRRF